MPLNGELLQIDYNNIANKPDVITKDEKGAPNGVAPLDSDGKIDGSFIPDDIVINGSGEGGVSSASELTVDTTNFDKIFDGNDNTAQLIFDKLDEKVGDNETAIALKTNISDIVDDLVTNDSLKMLSAKQGVVLKGFIDSINALLTSDDTSLDELQEIVNYIKQNKSELESLGISNIAGLQDALDDLQTQINTKESAFSKNTAFNKNFGTGSTDVATGDHSHPEFTTLEDEIALKEDKANKITAWQTIPDDTHYPSEKLVKEEIDSINTEIGDIDTALNSILGREV